MQSYLESYHRLHLHFHRLFYWMQILHLLVPMVGFWNTWWIGLSDRNSLTCLRVIFGLQFSLLMEKLLRLGWKIRRIIRNMQKWNYWTRSNLGTLRKMLFWFPVCSLAECALDAYPFGDPWSRNAIIWSPILLKFSLSTLNIQVMLKGGYWKWKCQTLWKKIKWWLSFCCIPNFLIDSFVLNYNKTYVYSLNEMFFQATFILL